MSEPGEENSPYKTPLLFLVIGLVLFVGGGVYLFKDLRNDPNTTIEHSNKESANKQTEQLIKVDINGAVKKPGVVELISNSRIEDALIIAGGFTKDADVNWISKNLNLAAKLIDGQKIYIPFANEHFVSPNSPNLLININAASSSDLEELPGVGPATAQKILEGRPYESTEQLLEKKIIGKSVFEKIKDRITLY